MSNSVLIELRTEELPPKALSHLGEVFKDEIFNGLVRCQLSQRVPANVSWFATPRLAVSVREVETTAADRVEEMKLMPVSVALDANGQPTQALRKKLEASGIPVSEIAKFETRMDGKAQALFYKATVKGVDLDAVLAGIVTQALKKLPIQKVMRWGDSEDQFVRPVHSLIMLHGTRVVPGTVLDSRVATRHWDTASFLPAISSLRTPKSTQRSLKPERSSPRSPNGARRLPRSSTSKPPN